MAMGAPLATEVWGAMAPPWAMEVCMAMGAPPWAMGASWVTGACMAMVDLMVLAFAALTPTGTAGIAVAAAGPAKSYRNMPSEV